MLKKTLFTVLTLFIFLSSQAQKWEDLNNQVLVHLGNGEYQKALSIAKQAKITAMEEFGENNADYSASLHNLASAHKKTGEYTPAEALYWEALKIDKQVLGAKHQNYALSLFGLANLYKLKKEFPKAESIYLDALGIMERAVSNQHPDYALILSDYADLQTELKQFDKAKKNLKKAKEITRYSVGEKHPDYAGVLFNIGKLKKEKGDITGAEETLTKALALFKSTLSEKHPDYKDCKRYLDNLYNPQYQLYKPAASEVAIIQGIERPALNSSPSASGTNPNMKISQVPTVQTKEEMAAAMEEEKIAKGEITKPIEEMVDVAVEVKPIEKEELVIEETSPPPPPAPKVKTWSDYSIMMDKHTQAGDYEKAIDVGQKALLLVKDEFGDEHENYTWISLKLADCYENAGMLNQAIPLYEHDLAYIEKTLGKDNRTYKKRRDELLAAYKDTGQKGKAQAFYKSSVYNSFEKFTTSSLLDQSRMMGKMEKEIEDYYSNSMKLGFVVGGTEMQNFNLAFKGRSTDAALAIASSMKGEIEKYQNQLRDKLKPNEATIDFLRMRDEKTKVGNYYALITRKSKTQTVLVPLLNEQKINVLINALPTSSDSYIQSADRSHQLYQLIWEPMEAHLKGVNFIHVSTVGVLNKVAFSGLMDKQKNYLADKYEIYYYSSLRDFINDKSVNLKNESVTFFGGVNYGGGANGKLDYMPATKDEVNTFKVVCAAKGWRVNTKVGSDASEQNIKALSGENAPGILHLATPVFYQHLEEFSGIALSNANDKIVSTQFEEDADDGLLNAKEIAKLDFSKTSLVLLSATETGADKNSAKGILSIQRALKNTGVNTILFSQWKVPDKQTQEMMALFYINRLSGMDVHRAFYSAQKAIRKLYASPYYWAGFVLIE